MDGKQARPAFNYSAYFKEIQLLHALTTAPGEVDWLAAPPRQPQPVSTVLYLGCNVLRTSHMVRTVQEVFRRLGVEYVAVGGPAYCCGIVHWREGDGEKGRQMGQRAMEYFLAFRPERVVMWCPSCILYYDDILQFPSPFPVQHVTEFLAEHLPRVRFVQEVPARVALHYHNAQPRRLQEAEAARTLLAAVPGVELVEVGSDPRLDRACSEATQQRVGHDTWEGLVRGQVERALEAGASVFATLYHGCQRLICGYEERYPLTIEHYLSVFARGLGIEFEDRFKKYRLWRDPRRVLAEMTPCMQANRVPAEVARQVVERTFPEG